MAGPLAYSIEHISRYSYAGPVRQCVMQLCLEPQDAPGQRLIHFDLTTRPPAPITEETDCFGNRKHVLAVHRKHDSLDIIARSEVEVAPPPPLPPSLGEGAWREVESWRESFADWDFTHPSPLVRPPQSFDDFTARLGIAPDGDPLEAVSRLSDALHRNLRYVPGVTSAASPLAHVLASGEGVCQDFAHVMIAVARSWGIPARYVSGYLYAADEEGKQETIAATHAWVECRLPGLGWTGFDPTNRESAGERHIRTAVGRDYSDVAPTQGVFQGAPESVLDVAVTVRPIR